MLTQFSIDNFRTFKHLNVPKLSRVNLISGKNNAGKTALLEAVYLHLAEFEREVVDFILQQRDEMHTKKAARNALSELRHLYFNHEINVSSHPLALRSNLSQQAIRIGASYRVKDENDYVEEFDTKLFDQTPFDQAFKRAINSEHSLFFLLQTNKKFKKLRPLIQEGANDAVRILSRLSHVYIAKPDIKEGNIQFISSKTTDPSDLEDLWSIISFSPLEQHVINALQIIEPRITDLRFVVVEGKDRIPLVKLSNQDDPVTLKSMGDGLSRIFEIILRMVNAKDGTLLIDEFENGLHWSVQADIWKVIFTLAETLNIQLFATTHSNDCIACFGKFWQADPDLASFHRLERRANDSIVAVSYSPDDINNALEMHVEVR